MKSTHVTRAEVDLEKLYEKILRKTCGFCYNLYYFLVLGGLSM